MCTHADTFVEVYLKFICLFVSSDTYECSLRCCWGSHSWSRTSHRPHPSLWDYQIIQGKGFHKFEKGKQENMWWIKNLAATSVATRIAVFPVLNSVSTHSLGNISIFNIPKLNWKCRNEQTNIFSKILPLGLLFVSMNAHCGPSILSHQPDTHIPIQSLSQQW